MDMEALEDALDPQIKTLVLYSPLNHESGAVQEAQAVFALAKKKNALVCVDAVQALFRLPRKLWLPWADICVVSGHKIGAPMGVGLLCVREESGFDPVLHDETLEFSLFDGTCNGPGIAAFDEALRDFVQHEADIFRHLSVLTAEGIDILANAPFPVHIETPKNSRRGILCISLPNIENIEDLLIFLSGRDVYVSRFSACSGDLSRPSAVLTAMGRPRERTQKSLRISLGENSQRSDFFVLRKALTEAHNRGV
jgi:cysteine desulfurase